MKDSTDPDQLNEEESVATATQEKPGRSVEEMAENGDAFDQEPDVFVEGTRGQLSWAVGGLEPASSTLTVSGMSALEVAGEFDKGEVLKLEVEVRVNSVEFADTDDPDGYAEACEKRFKGKVVSYKRLLDE
jgi:hypothetical protein